MTRPPQLMPTDEIAMKSVQSLLSVVGSYEGNIDGDFGQQSLNAYNALREQYSFLPDIGESLDASELPQILNAVSDGLQNNIAFQQAYVSGVSAEINVTELQGSLIAGGAWANRHLGDRISDAEILGMDGDRGLLTDRALRNSIKTTGISGMQSSLNLLTESELEINGTLDEATLGAMEAFAQSKDIPLGDNQQANFTLITTYIQENELNNIRAAMTATFTSDTDTSAPDLSTESTQVALSVLFNRPTAIDGRFTDGGIPVENSQTVAYSREVAAEAEVDAGAEAEAELNEICVICPFGIDNSYIITENSVVSEMSPLAQRLANNETSPEYMLAYSEEMGSYVLMVELENGHSGIYQISDKNAENLSRGIESGEIAIDVSAAQRIAERDFGNSSGTRSYTDADIRSAFVNSPRRFTGDTKESYLTSTAGFADGRVMRFGLDDLHDALDKQDGRGDWRDMSNPEAYSDYVKDLRQMAEDGREGRETTAPEWTGSELTDANSVYVNIAGNTVQMPAEVWQRVEGQMQESETRFQTGRNVRTEMEADPGYTDYAAEVDGAGAPDADVEESSGELPSVDAPAADGAAPVAEQRAAPTPVAPAQP